MNMSLKQSAKYYGSCRHIDAVQMEIEQRKNNDNNWKFANELSEGKALVNALGLDYDIPKDNQIFLQLPLPVKGLGAANKQVQPTDESGG